MKNPNSGTARDRDYKSFVESPTRGEGFTAREVSVGNQNDESVPTKDVPGVDLGNSTAIPLLSGETFTGEWVAREGAEMIMASFSDQNFTFQAEFANTLQDTIDGNIDSTISYTYTANQVNVPRRLIIAREYYRVVINKPIGSDMTELRFQTSIGSFDVLTSKLNARLELDADAALSRAIISGINERTKEYENVKLSRENNLLVEVDNVSITSFDELKTASRFAQIELKSAVDSVSRLRNHIEAIDGAVEVDPSGEYRVYTNATVGADVKFESGERGRYIPGYEAEQGIGVRLPNQTFAGTEYVEWGYFDDDNGIGWGRDALGVYIFVDRLGARTVKVYQENWNKDVLDGSNSDQNESGYTLDLSRGVVLQIEFIWYGYGAIQFFVNIKDVTSKRGSVQTLAHTVLPDQTTSIAQPNLPISVRVNNGDQATSKEVYIGGRQFSVYGEPIQKFRITGERRTEANLPVGVWSPIISFRRKAGSGNNQSVAVEGLDLIADGNIYYTFVTGGILTGATFGDLVDASPSETVVESDILATAITGGEYFGGEHIAIGNNQSRELASLDKLDFDFVNSDIVTIVGRPVGAQPVVVTAATFNVKEQW